MYVILLSFLAAVILQLLPPVVHSTSTPENQSQPGDTCTSIIATCVTVIVILVVVIVVLVIYIWKVVINYAFEKSGRKRSLSSIKGKDLEAYEDANPIDDASNVRVLESVKPRNVEKELYETICENKDEGAITHLTSTHPAVGALAVNEMTTRKSSGRARSEDSVTSLPPQHYLDLANLPKMPLYEPLNKRNTKQRTDVADDPRTYEQLQQNVAGREYQSLQIIPNKEESKV